MPDRSHPKPNFRKIIEGSHKDLEPFVTDISGRIPIFGYPLIGFQEKKQPEKYWGMIGGKITNPNVNNKYHLICELLQKYGDNVDHQRLIMKAFTYGKDLSHIGTFEELRDEFQDCTLSQYYSKSKVSRRRKAQLKKMSTNNKKKRSMFMNQVRERVRMATLKRLET